MARGKAKGKGAAAAQGGQVALDAVLEVWQTPALIARVAEAGEDGLLARSIRRVNKASSSIALPDPPVLGDWDAKDGVTRVQRFHKLVTRALDGRWDVLVRKNVLATVLASFTTEEINSYNDAGLTALHAALIAEHSLVREGLIAQVTYSDGCSVHLAMTLLGLGANPNRPTRKLAEKNVSGSTALHLFAKIVCMECYREALFCQMEMEPLSTPSSLKECYEDLFAALLGAGLDIKRVDGRGMDAEKLVKLESKSCVPPLAKLMVGAWKEVLKHHKKRAKAAADAAHELS